MKIKFSILGCPNADVVLENYVGMSEGFVNLYYEQGGTATIKSGNRNLCLIDVSGKTSVPYARVLIKQKGEKMSEINLAEGKEVIVIEL